MENSKSIQLYKEIESIISNIEQEVKSGITNKVAFLIQFVRMIDMAYLSSISDKEKNNDNLFERYIYGWPGILNIIYDEIPNVDGYPLFASNEELIKYGDVLLSVYSKAKSIKKILSMARYDLLNIKKIKDKEYKFTLADKYSQVEYQEVQDFMKYEKTKVNVIALMEETKEIKLLMENLVYTYKNYFIGYNSDRRVDNFYLVLGTCISDKYTTKHDFPEDAKFGGVKYVDYIAAIVVFIGITLKHIEFCNILVRKDPKIEYINIISVFKKSDEEIETLSTVLNISRETATKIIDVLTYSKSDLDKLNNNFNSAYPMFLKVAKDILVRSALGFIVNPFGYLMQQLRNRFPNDWSREINSREKLFRDQLYCIIPNEVDCIKIDKNINIYKNKKLLTDIDALIIDLKSNTMVLFQLKWQEPFGGSMNERNSKKNNFIEASNKWVKSVSDWIMSSDAKQKADILGLKKEALEKIKNYKLFVVGRHFSKFSDCSIYDERAVWCNWYKFNEVCGMIDIKNTKNYFNKLESLLREDFNKSMKVEVDIQTSHIDIGEYKFYLG